MKYSFGKTKSAIALEQLVENNRYARCRVAKIIGRYNKQLFVISQLNDSTVPETIETGKLCMELLKNHTLEKINKLKVSSEIQSCLRCMIIARYRLQIKHLSRFK